MQFILKLLLANCLIVAVVLIGKKLPSLGGLLVTMPITSLAAMLWLYSESQNKKEVMTGFAKGALWGIFPTIIFFIAAYICFGRGYPLWIVLAVSFACWAVGAAVHQWIL